MKVSRKHVLRMLRISGNDNAETLEVIDALTFPAELEDVAAVLSRFGITTDSLIDEMGGSP